MKMEIKVPSVATIGVSGPVQCGKSTVMLRLAQVLQDEFGATVVLNDELAKEKNQTRADLQKWERDMVKRTVWVLAE